MAPTPSTAITAETQRKESTRFTRTRVRRWWLKHGGHSDFCGIYNNGDHLYIAPHVPPGTFFLPEVHTFTFFPFIVHSIDVGDIWIAHRGHLYGLLGGQASIIAFVTDELIPITIPPYHMVYLMKTDTKSKLEYTTARMNLPIGPSGRFRFTLLPAVFTSK